MMWQNRIKLAFGPESAAHWPHSGDGSDGGGRGCYSSYGGDRGRHDKGNLSSHDRGGYVLPPQQQYYDRPSHGSGSYDARMYR